MVSKYRTVFISDLHIGMFGSQTDQLNQFLKHIDCEKLVLVGDIIDLWNLRRSFHWDEGSTKVIRRILKMSQKGTKVIYVTGNHDDAVRLVTPLQMGEISIVDYHEHYTAAHEKLIVIHGDQFDFIVTKAKWLAKVGAVAYEYLMKINAAVTWIRAKFGRPYWSFASYIKYRVKQASLAIRNFESALVEFAASRGGSGVICGHIHAPKLEDVKGVLYGNCGDWIESCSAIVEHDDGSLELVRYHSSHEHATGVLR